MMIHFKPALGALTLAVALLPLSADAQNITTVNGKPVPKARAELLIKQVTKSGQQQRTPELESQVNNEVVLREIFLQEAERQGVTRGEDFRDQMELARQALAIRGLFESYAKRHPVTDAEAQAEYDKVKAQNGGTEYRARHILVETEDEATALISQLKGGASFEELAKSKSKDSGSGANGGDLDWANPAGFVPEFSQAMVALKKGELTLAPVKSQFGWHIIRLDDVREAQFPGFDEVKAQLVQRLSQQKLADYQKQLRAAAKTDYKFPAQQ